MIFDKDKILIVDGLTVEYIKTGEKVVDDLSFSLKEHHCLAIVGESGSGKSMTVKCINQMLPSNFKNKGEIFYKGLNLMQLSKSDMKKIRGSEIFMIFQDAMSAFDPSLSIEKSCLQILEENTDKSEKDLLLILQESLKKVNLKNPDLTIKKYPHQLSGGMLQRIIIALAFALKPSLIIADEPTTALDTITQFEIIEEFIKLKENLNTSIVFISHDLGVVKKIADDVILLKNGVLVEQGAANQMLSAPKSEYGKYLIGNRHKMGEKYFELMGGC
ncbi:nickel transport system ATP-binding protein [Peptostreptococcaceae bacterium pGA-8]|nr:nickel transport system ATP-binding protein [Peptostreptococcaceae bacterium pGA-8]